MFGSSKDKTPIRTIDSAAAKQIDTVIAEQCTLEGDLTTKSSVKAQTSASSRSGLPLPRYPCAVIWHI